MHELVEKLGAPQPLVSQHLRVLRGAGVVRGARRGREIAYSLVDEHVAHIVADAVSHAREVDHDRRRRSSLRNTKQRSAVSAVLAEAEGFNSAQDLHAMLRERGERVGLTTVYRTLQGLADAGEIDVMRPPGGEHLYRRCSQGHHHHLVCRSCGRAVEVEGPAVETWADKVAAQHGFVDVSHTLEIFGTCPECAARHAELRRGTLSRVKIYADRLPTAVRQLLTDLLVVLWVYAWIRAGLWIHDMVEKLGVPGQKLQGAGTGIADNLADAGGKVGRVPLVGDELTAPFNRAADAARSLADAGRQQQEVVGNLALAIALLVDRRAAGAGAVPLAAAAAALDAPGRRWPPRCATSPAGRDLLALRALASQPLNELAKLGPDIAAVLAQRRRRGGGRAGRAGAQGPRAQAREGSLAPRCGGLGGLFRELLVSSSSSSSTQLRRAHGKAAQKVRKNAAGDPGQHQRPPRCSAGSR